MKKLLYKAMGVLLLAGVVTGCGAESSSEEFDMTREFSVISREDGSGTRGAFIELLGIEQKDADGNKVDYTTEEAMITNSTSVMMTTVAGDKYAIGYISLGSLNDSVKALDVDGVEATAENIKNDTYKVARPFNIATHGELSEATQDFMNFILSSQGQKVVEETGYVSEGNTGNFTSTNISGKVVVAGSSSVTPVMEKLKEAYVTVNPNIEIEIQQSDSTTGMTSVMEGICDIGMASRELKDSELERGLTAVTIALDGIAIIVNNNCLVDDLTSEAIKDIYMGEVTVWEDATE